jgi:hypothetical protein
MKRWLFIYRELRRRWPFIEGILRGNAVAYRLHVHGGIYVPPEDHAVIGYCFIHGDKRADYGVLFDWER